MVRSPRRSEEQARRPDIIEPGLYKLSLVRQGWKVPCQIISLDFRWLAEIDERRARYTVTDPFDCPQIVRIHEWGEKISDRQYDWLVGIKGWARQHDQDHPCLNPRTPMDPMKLRPLIPRSKQWMP
jgi:hypothetical protein